ncbi:hypothetical protein BDZ45DRAFT_702099 [Acephala macrosclerotiorum]|nr:hypothetical protein BDZ45DRAFT_702099 [Acephala macrosclerotiorum]
MDHALIRQAKDLPITTSKPFLTLTPIVLPSPGRPVDLYLKVSAPTTGTSLSIILLSHSHGRSNNLSSFNGYGPLVTFWASHGFVSSFPGLQGRLDKTRITVAGHSLGAYTASMLLGAQLKDPSTGDITPALVVVGDNDISLHFTERGADWHADPYFWSEGKKSLLILFGGEHGLGGIAGWDAGETTDESVEMVEMLYPEDRAWEVACAALKKLDAIGKVVSK